MKMHGGIDVEGLPDGGRGAKYGALARKRRQRRLATGMGRAFTHDVRHSVDLYRLVAAALPQARREHALRARSGGQQQRGYFQRLRVPVTPGVYATVKVWSGALPAPRRIDSRRFSIVSVWTEHR